MSSTDRKRPLVSVVIGVYNTMPYFTATMTSAVEQTIGHDRMEIIVVDDGSTDGSGEELDRFAKLYPDLIRAYHQENSGGPAQPRNRGIDMARGEYIFFLDADDTLGLETLERAVAVAEANKSDVVLCKMVGVNGRGVAQSMFKQSAASVDLYNSTVYNTLGPLKLYRRSLLDEHNIRFDETMPTGEDQPFTAQAYIHARNISVIADYDCLFVTARGDGTNTSAGGGAEPRVRIITTMLPLLASLVPAGPKRDHLMRRHLTLELHRAFHHIVYDRDADPQRLLADLRDAITPVHSRQLFDKLPAIMRLRYHLLLEGRFEEVLKVQRYTKTRLAELGRKGMIGWQSLFPAELTVERGRAYAQYPYFRDEELPLPDSLFDITDELPRKAVINGVRLGDAIDVRVNGTAAALPGKQGPSAMATALKSFKVSEVAWEHGAREAKLRVSGHFPTAQPKGGTLWLTATTGDGAVKAVEVAPGEQPGKGGDAGAVLTAVLPLEHEGDWKLEFVMEHGGSHARRPVPAAPGLPALRWRRAGGIRYARPLAKKKSLVLRVGRVSLAQGVRKKLTGK